MLPTPVTMKHMQLMMLRDDAQAAAFALSELEVMHPEAIKRKGEQFHEFPAQSFQEVFHRIQARYKKIMDLHGERTDLDTDTALRQVVINKKDMAAGHQQVSLGYLEDIEQRLKELWVKVSAQEEKLRQIKDRRAAIGQQQASLQRFLSLDVDLSRVGRQTRFLNVITGTVINANTQRLANALSLSGYVLETYHAVKNQDYVLIIGPSDSKNDVDELLKSADFREISIPEEFSDRPQMVWEQLNEQAGRLDESLVDCAQQLEDQIADDTALLNEVTNLLHRALPYASLATYLKARGRLVSLQGWVPESRQYEIQSALAKHLQYPFFIHFESPRAEEYEQVPTLLKNSPLVSPFQALVRQYGLPQYGEFDPGLLFALSYTLMFGMMFGDVGHGGVIALLSLWLINKSRVIGVVGGLAGLSSMAFGFVYGSVFGYEHVLHPLWMSPMHDPQQVLLLALYWGIGFLIIANLLAIRNMIIYQHYDQALYSPQGVAGLLFYTVSVYSLSRFFGEQAVLPDWPPRLLTVLMLIMLYHQWKHASGRLFERLLVVIIEGLEFIISNVSATLSFLRVAAFTLNHIALAAAVFALAAMLDEVGHWIAIVLGNIFIIVLEGAIVAIQCLRLEYYEGFSRYFSGKGRQYDPLKTDYL